MDAWVKNLLQPLLMAIVGTAVGSGSLFVLGAFLWRLMMKWCSQARDQFLAPPPDVESGDQPGLPEGNDFGDVEMGLSMNGGEAAVGHVPSGVAANGSIPGRHDVDGAGLGGFNKEMTDRCHIHVGGLPCSSRLPLANANASGV